MLAVTYYLFPALVLAQLAAGSSMYYSRSKNHISFCPADAEEAWTYRGDNGPEFWGETYPDCNNQEQSPIDIMTDSVEEDENLAKLDMTNYNTPVTSATIVNNGHTVQLTPTDNVERSVTIGNSTYTLRQLHFHWGKAFFRGSEHTLDGRQYALEMHLVHMNENNEIAVVGVLFRECGHDNPELQNIVDALPEVTYKDTETEMTGSLNLNNLVPENPASYYRYQGSLTTPGCTEGVTWSVLTNILTVRKHQMSEFRKLYSATQEEARHTCKISGNYRPVQPLNDRQVYLSQ